MKGDGRGDGGRRGRTARANEAEAAARAHEVARPGWETIGCRRGGADDLNKTDALSTEHDTAPKLSSVRGWKIGSRLRETAVAGRAEAPEKKLVTAKNDAENARRELREGARVCGAAEERRLARAARGHRLCPTGRGEPALVFFFSGGRPRSRRPPSRPRGLPAACGVSAPGPPCAAAPPSVSPTRNGRTSIDHPTPDAGRRAPPNNSSRVRVETRPAAAPGVFATRLGS